jgi:hypothetical protein
MAPITASDAKNNFIPMNIIYVKNVQKANYFKQKADECQKIGDVKILTPPSVISLTLFFIDR